MSARSSPYEAAGHLISGLLILGACEAAHDGRWLINRDWPPSRISLYMTMAYSIGQVVAALSRILVEQTFVRKCLRMPQDILLTSALSRSWRHVLFSAYFQPLADADRLRILQEAARDGVSSSDYEIFDHACAVVEREETAQRRVDLFRQVADLCRNLCLGLLIVAAILISGMLWHSVSSTWGKSDWRKLGYCTLALLEAVGMLYRYLRFSRRHAVEVLTRFAAADGLFPPA
jgi:hypothetical protein